MPEATDPLAKLGVQIVSDGLGRNTKVYLPNGTEISQWMRSFKVECEGPGPLQAEIGFFVRSVEAKSGVVFEDLDELIRALQSLAEPAEDGADPR